MDATKTNITIYGISPQQAEDFEFDYRTTPESDIVQGLVPDQDNWGGIGWIELEEYEYNPTNQTMLLTLETKWAPPIEWLQHASLATHYFENRLMVLTTIQRDETCVTGAAVMDGEILQNKYIFEMSLQEVSAHYEDECDDALDDLDYKIWNSITQFVTVCEQFYLEKDTTNHDN